jgi:hypothetical protein
MPLIDPVSLANAEAGNALAVYLYAKNGPSIVKGLTDLATDLPLIPLGKVTAGEFGALTAELQNYKSAVAASSAAGEVVASPPVNLAQLLDQLISLISLVTSSFPSASGGLETLDQAVAVQYLGNWSAGITNALSFEAGKASATQSATP